MIIKPIKLTDIPFVEDIECKQLGIIFKPDIKYIAAILNGEVVGVVGCKVYKNKYKFTNAFVRKDFRHKGIYRQLNAERRNYCSEKKPIEANCTINSVSFHVKRGAKILKVFKNGITKIRYENI